MHGLSNFGNAIGEAVLTRFAGPLRLHLAINPLSAKSTDGVDAGPQRNPGSSA